MKITLEQLTAKGHLFCSVYSLANRQGFITSEGKRNRSLRQIKGVHNRRRETNTRSTTDKRDS
ncbi:hypothetical protein M3226_24420 [Neobacillus cucumis]|uniref:hypothetical protein n=1 Tax=Neobacillus cucumis TaxID=1740721 RepID=UPI002040FFD9|nr:hypothetical protein [Neobacillus cucumis]MCM3728793.1 hypothetical protein [Neobacillus cucumis]